MNVNVTTMRRSWPASSPTWHSPLPLTQMRALPPCEASDTLGCHLSPSLSSGSFWEPAVPVVLAGIVSPEIPALPRFLVAVVVPGGRVAPGVLVKLVELVALFVFVVLVVSVALSALVLVLAVHVALVAPVVVLVILVASVGAKRPAKGQEASPKIRRDACWRPLRWDMTGVATWLERSLSFERVTGKGFAWRCAAI